jgi:hypothetical protein
MRSRLGVMIAIASLFATATLPVSAASDGPVLIVANPNSGDMLTPGRMMLQGVAFDREASQGSGVDRVSIFLDDRDLGGQFLGDATLGATTTVGGVPLSAGWTLTTPPLAGGGQLHELHVYARNADGGDETVVSIPITIGEKIRTDGPAGDSEESGGD